MFKWRNWNNRDSGVILGRVLVFENEGFEMFRVVSRFFKRFLKI